jgi:hypothetical protein
MHTAEQHLTWRTLLHSVRLREGGLLTLLLFLLTRPYIGIQHDARLYVGYALAKIDPKGIGQDLLFTADGQSGYSLFPPVFLRVVDVFGPSTAAMVVTVSGLMVWYFAFRQFLSRVLPGAWGATQVEAAAIAFIALTPYYGGTAVFRIAEPYVTPRIFAEALVIATMTMLTVGSRWFAIPLGLAAAVHPLMAAPAVGVATLMRTKSSRSWIVIILLSATALGLITAVSTMITLQTGVWGRFDNQWQGILNAKRSLVFMRYWTSRDFSRVILHIATVTMAWELLTSEVRRLAAAILSITIFGLASTYIGADLTGHIGLSQLQPWRATWLLSLMAMTCVPVLLASCLNRQGSGLAKDAVIEVEQLSVAILLTGWMIVETNEIAAAFAISAGAIWIGARRFTHFSPYAIRAARGVIVLLAGYWVAMRLWVTTATALGAPKGMGIWNFRTLELSGLPQLFCLWLAFRMLNECRTKISPMPYARVTTGLVACLLLRFDSRTPYQRYLEDTLDSYIAKGERVIRAENRPLVWPAADLEPWAFAGRPAWGTELQGIPAVFSRELAIRWHGRWQRLAPFGGLDRTFSRATDGSLNQFCLLGESDPADIVFADGNAFSLHEPKPLRPTRFRGAWEQVQNYGYRSCK